ncbi:MAG TPA: YetF domain-containing protein [Thermomicrobiales bacterium]|nr:YetF domain-containing protein [Thermomicrobiales bacterium]
MSGIDWGAVFLPDTPVLEIVIRGSVMYLALFALLRFVLRREAGSVGVADLLVIVLIADAAQNGMATDYTSIADGIVLVATIIFWAYALNWLGYHFPAVQRLIHPPPLPLVRDGRLLRRNMRQELITEDELLSQLRLQGCEDLADVEFAAIEGDGRISVVMRDGKGESNRAPERQT